MMLRVRSKRAVYRWTLAITALAVVSAVGTVLGIMALVPGMPVNAMIFGGSIAFIIPLLIAPPCAYLALSIMHMLHHTIEKVDSQIRFDALTGTLNRSHFLDQVRDSKNSGGLMIVDADHFKRVNDTRGHAAGDEVLRILANCLAQTVAAQGMVGRLGGEEFGVYLPQHSEKEIRQMGEKLCESVRSMRMIVEGKPLSITISIGGAMWDANSTIGNALKVADEQLYFAKEQGRDRALFNFTGKMVEPEAVLKRA